MAGMLTSEAAPTGTTRLGRLAGRERGWAEPTVRVRAAAQLSGVVVGVAYLGCNKNCQASARPYERSAPRRHSTMGEAS